MTADDEKNGTEAVYDGMMKYLKVDKDRSSRSRNYRKAMDVKCRARF
ncbi:hypothetical protein [Parasphingorhabdus halotolerans]|uniref:Uncharacterized protein n=1 Tax=Parasphingorhabdus halotolerans TaxID=2725558 RepID=A0A6H2DMP5_9SPHN|nr:hypothetical protein [Parasphingorhabdus halotolerans]QJB69939.1 hypothetical protein HF685_12120 [Parasphingorhabdus halotolerans]